MNGFLKQYEKLLTQMKYVSGQKSRITQDFAFQMNMTGEDAGVFYIQNHESTLNIQPYNYYDYTVCIETTWDILFGIFDGKIKFRNVMNEGKIHMICREIGEDEKAVRFFEDYENIKGKDSLSAAASELFQENSKNTDIEAGKAVSVGKRVLKQQDALASAEIVVFNPVLREDINIRIDYYRYLRSLIRHIKRDKRKYTRAQLIFYKNKLCEGKDRIGVRKKVQLPVQFIYLLPFDLALILAFQADTIGGDKGMAMINKIVSDYDLPIDSEDFLKWELKAAIGEIDAWDKVLNDERVKKFKQYLEVVRTNICFVKQRPYNILITATMSAGKSTLINALTGKNITLTQNMACTSKIHTVISKSSEDGVSSEYDHEMLMDASREDLLEDNDDNKSPKITVGTYFTGGLGGKRVILLDSPGVNSSENIDHKVITQRMIDSKKYKLLLYILNATQLATEDEVDHLRLVAKIIGRTKLLFVLNKIDNLDPEEENFADIIGRQREFLISIGFRKPIICPLSSRAAYLVKKSQVETLNRVERREMLNYADKFEEFSLSAYYENQLKCPQISFVSSEEQNLMKNCGFAYFEKIIENLYNGGKINDTGIC